MTAHTPLPDPQPLRCVVPKVSGDAAAAQRLSVDYSLLADVVYAARQQVAVILEALSAAWSGPSAQAIEQPIEKFLGNAAALTRALDEAASAYSEYSRRLEAAHAAHRWSMHKILKIGAVAAVSATAVVVTVGAAGAVEAAAAGAAVSGASEAAEAGLLADTMAAAAVDSVLDALPSLRPLLSFVLPHLLQAEWVAGAMATWDEATTGKLRWRALGETAALAVVASGTAAGGRNLVSGSRWAPHVVEGAAWGGSAAAGDELIDHRLSVADISETFVLAGGSTAGRDALRAHGMWPEPPDYRREALVSLLRRPGLVTDRDIAHELAVLRQPVRELERGAVDLRLHEGPGHTIARHVGKTSVELRTRIRTDRIPRASTYWDDRGAREAIEATLTANRDAIRRWSAADYPDTLRLRLSSPYDLGMVVDRRGMVRFVRQAVVVLRHDGNGVVMVTSYPIP